MEAMGLMINTANDNNVLLSKAAESALAQTNRVVNSAMFALEQLETQREQWESTEMAAAHQRLYVLLTACYDYYLKMKVESGQMVREHYKKALDTFIDMRGYRTHSGVTHDMNKVVKAVFGCDRKRVSAYAKALRAALVAGKKDAQGRGTPLTAGQVSAWIAEQGGIEEIRLGSKNSGLTAKQRAEVAATALKSSVLMTVKPNARVMPFSVDDNDKTVLLLAVYRPTGELEVSAVVKNDTAVRAALAAHFNADKGAVLEAAETALKDGEVETATAIAMGGAQ
jgi:hypothetical protein